MSRDNQLGITYFRCPKCASWTAVEARGIVISGPICKTCKAPMKKTKMQQLNLGLFDEKPSVQK